ncbi:fasciclin-1-like [Dendroctonus ponderosae]|uniref:fasciclin-1-like n=1 Tax=Dendroctonus ponderosae TaxID=77166 RepID=UPI002035D6FA|nr:fasciclin-1-like [Dendroctonus ponderosae]
MYVLLILLGCAPGLGATPPQPTVYNRLTQEAQFQGFAGLVHYNRAARLALLQNRITVFAPSNEAFAQYGRPLHSDLAWYHMAGGVWTLRDLQSARNLTAGAAHLPPLWLTATNRALYINNARVVAAHSDYLGNAHAQQQALHVIDRVLDPMHLRPGAPMRAFDWLRLARPSAAIFLHRLKELRLEHLLQLEGANTYFIPADDGFDPAQFHALDKSAIFGHLVPGEVLFTRPAMRSLNHETMANSGDVYRVVSFEDKGGQLMVRQRSLAGAHRGDTWAPVLQADLPVANGVLHLIGRPLGLRPAPRPFPFLPILLKLAGDPQLATVYEAGESTGFNQIFSTHNASFTYFVPNERAWGGRSPPVDLLKRHLVVGGVPYSMERLLALSSAQNYTPLALPSVGGALRLAVAQIGSRFYVKIGSAYIKVLRPNYQCTDGLVHVIAAPL